MAKEGFDWIWCEHALTIGYRSSLTEIIQIIGRATRDAPGKTRARFTVELHQEICQLLSVARLPSVETIQRNIEKLRNDKFGIKKES